MGMLETNPDPPQEQPPLRHFSNHDVKDFNRCSYPAWSSRSESFPKEVQLQTQVGGVKQQGKEGGGGAVVQRKLHSRGLKRLVDTHISKNRT